VCLVALLIFSGSATVDHHLERRRWYLADAEDDDGTEDDMW
jgi:hypothetical protein